MALSLMFRLREMIQRKYVPLLAPEERKHLELHNIDPVSHLIDQMSNTEMLEFISDQLDEKALD